MRVLAGGLSTQATITLSNKNNSPPPPTGLVKVCKRAGDYQHWSRLVWPI